MFFAPLTMDGETLYTYDKLYKTLSYDVDCFIYLDVDPIDAFHRIRNRSPVDNLISLDYLRRLYDSYKFNLIAGRSNVFVVNDALPVVVEEKVRTFLVKKIASID